MSLAEILTPMGASGLERSSGAGPSEGFARNIVEVVDETQSPHAQVVHGDEADAIEQVPREDGEPNLDSFEPGTMSWRIPEAGLALGVSQECVSRRARYLHQTYGLLYLADRVLRGTRGRL